jgi:hypothetical protein
VISGSTGELVIYRLSEDRLVREDAGKSLEMNEKP